MSICQYCEKIFVGCSDDDRSLRPLAELVTKSAFECPLCNYFKAHLGYKNAADTSKISFSLRHYHEIDLILPLWFGTPRLPILELQVIEEDSASPRPITYRAFTTEGTVLSRSLENQALIALTQMITFLGCLVADSCRGMESHRLHSLV